MNKGYKAVPGDMILGCSSNTITDCTMIISIANKKITYLFIVNGEKMTIMETTDDVVLNIDIEDLLIRNNNYISKI